MRALSIEAPGRVALRGRADPVAGRNEVLVAVRVGGVCKGDVSVFHGDDAVPLPYFGGHESAGTVLEVGQDVDEVAPGDNIALLGDGRFSELTVAPVEKVALLPTEIEDWRDWIVEPFACAVNGVDRAAIRFDDRVAVVGCGFMGLLVIRALALTPFRDLLAFDIADDRLALARASGATHTFRADESAPELLVDALDLPPLRPMPQSYVLPGLQNGPADVVFEASGTRQGLALASQLARVGGTVIMFGHQRGQVSVDGTGWHLKGLHVINASPMSAPDFHGIFRRTAALMTAGRLRMHGLVSHSAHASTAQEVFDASSSPGYIKGAIQFDHSSEAAA